MKIDCWNDFKESKERDVAIVTYESDQMDEDPHPEQVVDYIDYLTTHPGLALSERNRRFLQFVASHAIKNNAIRISVHEIAVAVFSRGPKFDPQLDPIVRVEASRVRKALHAYYTTIGQTDHIRVDLPRGKYVPTFSKNPRSNAQIDTAGARSNANDEAQKKYFGTRRAANDIRMRSCCPLAASMIVLAIVMASVWSYQSTDRDFEGAPYAGSEGADSPISRANHSAVRIVNTQFNPFKGN